MSQRAVSIFLVLSILISITGTSIADTYYGNLGHKTVIDKGNTWNIYGSVVKPSKGALSLEIWTTKNGGNAIRHRIYYKAKDKICIQTWKTKYGSSGKSTKCVKPDYKKIKGVIDDSIRVAAVLAVVVGFILAALPRIAYDAIGGPFSAA